MANWVTDEIKANSSTMGEVKSFDEVRQSNRTNYTSKSSHNQYSVVGLNASQISGMRTQVRNYVANIQKELDNFATKSEATSTAFKGEDVHTAVVDYINETKKYVQNLVSYMLVFSDKLKDVEEAWTQFQQSTGQNIKTSTGSFGTKGAYQEKL